MEFVPKTMPLETRLSLDTAFQRDPNNMVGYGLSCINRKRKKLKGWQKK